MMCNNFTLGRNIHRIVSMKKLILIIFLLLSTSIYAEEKSSFWSKTDEFLLKGTEWISKKDKITGLRSLNTTSDKKAKKRGIVSLNYYVQYAKKNNVKVFKSKNKQYKRVKAILDRIILASHFRNEKDLRFEVIDFEDVNALAFGGGNFLVFSGLLNMTTDDELAFVIAHELAHNAASHNEEKEHYMRMKDVFGEKPTKIQRIVFTNIMEQEADRVGLIYAALAGFDPCASVSFARKLSNVIRKLYYL